MSDISALPESGHNTIRTEIATSVEQLLQIFALRATTFWQEIGFPYQLAFDQNDFQATHSIAYIENEPIGAMRIRWFRDFAKIERTAFRSSHRNIPNVKVLSDFTFTHIARKGYDTVITHAAPKFARLWKMHFGFQQVDKLPAIYEGEKYYELKRSLKPPTNVIDLDCDVAVLFRTEGYWDAPGKYETTE